LNFFDATETLISFQTVSLCEILTKCCISCVFDNLFFVFSVLQLSQIMRFPTSIIFSLLININC